MKLERGSGRTRWKKLSAPGAWARSTGRAIPVSSDETFKAGLPETSFDAVLFPLVIRNRYSVTDDGERFLLLSPITGESIRPISVVLNWNAGLEP